MKNRIPLFLCLSLLLLAFHGPESGTPLIKQSVNLKNGNSTDYKYDSRGRLVLVQSSKGAKTVYEYADSVVVKRFFDSPKSKAVIDTFFLSDKNLTSIISNNKHLMQRCKYDSRGRLTVRADYTDGKSTGRAHFTWSGDNLKNFTRLDETGKPSNILTYFYYTDKLNTLSNKNMGLDFLGPESKYLLKESVGLAAVATSSDTFRLAYHYQFDANNAVKLKVGYNAKGELIDSTSYSYY